MDSTPNKPQYMNSIESQGSCHRRTFSQPIELDVVHTSHDLELNSEALDPEESILNKIDLFLEKLDNCLDELENLFITNNNKKPRQTIKTSSMVESESQPSATLFDFIVNFVGNDKAQIIQNAYDTLTRVKEACQDTIFSTSSSTSSSSSFSVLERGKARAEALLRAFSDNNDDDVVNYKLNDPASFKTLTIKIDLLDQKTNLLENFSSQIKLQPTDLTISIGNSIESHLQYSIKQGLDRNLTFHELPIPWRENHYIINGYRFHNNFLRSIKSIFQLHNETANIWTHLLGFIGFIYIWAVEFPKTLVYANSNILDRSVIGFFFIMVLQCLLCSVSWHTFNCTSNLSIKTKCACLDYTGITLLVSASVITTEYAALYYHEFQRNLIMSFSLILGFIGLFFNWSPYFDKPENRHFRILFFIALATGAISAFAVASSLYGTKKMCIFYFPILKSITSYLIGVIFYGTLFPEIMRTDCISYSHKHHHHVHHSSSSTIDIDNDNDLSQSQESNSDAYTLFINNPEESYNGVPLINPLPIQYTTFWDYIKSYSWVDYIFQSHNMWHIFVLGGALYHYYAVLEMLENIPKVLAP